MRVALSRVRVVQGLSGTFMQGALGDRVEHCGLVAHSYRNSAHTIKKRVAWTRGSKAGCRRYSTGTVGTTTYCRATTAVVYSSYYYYYRTLTEYFEVFTLDLVWNSAPRASATD